MVKIISKLAIIILSAILIAGCATPSTRIVYKEVKVPTYIIPVMPTVQKPVLPIHNISAKDANNIAVLGPAYVLSTRELLNYSSILNYIIDYYNCLANKKEYSVNDYNKYLTELKDYINEYKDSQIQILQLRKPTPKPVCAN